MRFASKMKRGALFITLSLSLLTFPALAKAAPPSIGRVVHVQGEVHVTRAETSHTLSFNDAIYPMDILETGDGELKVLFKDQTLLRLIAHSKVLVSKYVYNPQHGIREGIFDIIKGSVRTIVEKMANMKNDDIVLRTPTAVAGIRGTDVGTRVAGKKTQYLCFDGLIETFFRKMPNLKVLVGAGLFTTIDGSPPTTPRPIPTRLRKMFSGNPQLTDILSQQGFAPLPAGTINLPDVSGENPFASTSPAAEALLPGGANDIREVIPAAGSGGDNDIPGDPPIDTGPAGDPNGNGTGGGTTPPTDPPDNGGNSDQHSPVKVPTNFPEGG